MSGLKNSLNCLRAWIFILTILVFLNILHIICRDHWREYDKNQAYYEMQGNLLRKIEAQKKYSEILIEDQKEYSEILINNLKDKIMPSAFSGYPSH